MRDAKGRFLPSAGRKHADAGKGSRLRNGGKVSPNGDGRLGVKVSRPRDSKGRFRSKIKVRTDYVREIEALRRELEALKVSGKQREREIERNYKKRGGAYDKFVAILSIGQQKRLDEYLDDVYDGKISKEDFVTMAVNSGLSVREAWAVLYS